MSEMNSSVAIMNQVPSADAGVRGESPLHHVGLAEIAGQSNADAGVVFSEAGLLGHLTLRCDPNSPLIACCTVDPRCGSSTQSILVLSRVIWLYVGSLQMSG